jgi:DNA-binding transcriptional MerR regulator
MEKSLPAIPAKRYFTIGEVSELCGVKPYVLRYWEQEFTQLKPMKRRGNRRYYQHHEVLLIRRIRDLLYEQGFTISGARNRLTELNHNARGGAANNGGALHDDALAAHAAGDFDDGDDDDAANEGGTSRNAAAAALSAAPTQRLTASQLRDELLAIRDLLAGG